MKKFKFLGFVLFFAVCTLNAAPVQDSLNTFQFLTKEFEKEKTRAFDKYLTLDTLGKRSAVLNREVFFKNIALEKQKRAQIEDENFAIRHRWRSFNFQYVASIIIFILVIIIVLAGLIFSGWQFNFALKQMKLKEKIIDHAAMPADDGNGRLQNDNPIINLHNELELSTSGIKVNSSILGVIILALSIAFFYLYIIYVYPIKYISAPVPVEIASDKEVELK